MFESILPVVGKGGARHKGGDDQYQYPYKWPLREAVIYVLAEFVR